jgi:hypothetical protein
MPTMQGGSRLDVITRQWHDLANRRLAYFTELYRSGRWQRYYSQEHFALRMLDVIRAERAWRDLAGRSWRKPSARHDDDLRHAA